MILGCCWGKEGNDLPFIVLTVGLVILLLVGIPAAFSLIMSSTILLGIQRGFDQLPYGMIAQRVVYGIDSFPLLAVPLFVFVGQLMNEAGVTERIFSFAKTIVGHLRAGLAHVNIVASLIFAGMSGSSVADAAGLGAVEIKAMTDNGYDLDFSVGVTAGSALIGPILPPSIPVVLYAILANVSVTKLLIAGIIPGFLMAACLMGYVYIRARKSDYPVSPRADFRTFWASFKRAFFPLLTPIILVGGIVGGIFTATEAAGVASVYALILFLIYSSLNWKLLINLIQKTVLTSCGIMFVLASAQLYSTMVIRSRIPIMIAEKIFLITDSYWMILLLSIIILLISGCFMSAAVSIGILTPVLVPLVMMVGIDPLYFGIMMITTLMIGELTPPFGMVLFAIMGICDISFDRLVKSAIKFAIPVLFLLTIMYFVPGVVTFLPNALK
jgi:tripartite ATP-independent transporter DctM subunit